MLYVRQTSRGVRLGGLFRYGDVATLRSRGRQRKEVFAPGAFEFSVNRAEIARKALELAKGSALPEARQEMQRANIHVLSGHSYDRPLGSVAGGNLTMRNTPEGVAFDVDLPETAGQPSWVKDAVDAVDAGLYTGISPGFQLPPATRVANAVTEIPEPGNPGVTIMRVNDAILRELSLVSRPAYTNTEIARRSLKTARKAYIWL